MNKIIKHQAYSLTVGQREVDGFVNATALCQAAGKKLGHYLETQQTQAFLEALGENLNRPPIVNNPDIEKAISALVATFKGGNSQQGTWVHPQVAIHLAMWLSPQFSVLVTQWVLDWMNTGKSPVNPPAPQPEQKALGPSPLHPEVSQKTFDAAPLLDRIYWAESPAERTERIRRESREIWRQ